MFKDPALIEDEMFGPASLVVAYDTLDEVADVLATYGGSLTATVQGADDDGDAARLLDILSERAGRVIWNQWPTGVTVTDAQQHGGPWPSTTRQRQPPLGPRRSPASNGRWPIKTFRRSGFRSSLRG